MNNDLISRAALLENYGLKNAVKYGNETADQQHNSYSTLMLYEIADMIYDAPAVDAEPVRRGNWRVVNLPKKWRGVTARCSECNNGAIRMWNYCPDCGAKMRGNDSASE